MCTVMTTALVMPLHSRLLEEIAAAVAAAVAVEAAVVAVRASRESECQVAHPAVGTGKS